MLIDAEKTKREQNVLPDLSIHLDRNGGVLLYHQVEEFIRQKIQTGEWAKGYQLPSEPELAKAFDVSRATIRQSIFNLVQKGMLERRHGTGTYVLHTAEMKEKIKKGLQAKEAKEAAARKEAALKAKAAKEAAAKAAAETYAEEAPKA